MQKQPIIVQFDTAVTTVSIYGVGAFECYTGTYGHLTAYDAAGNVLSAVAMQMREPEDCAADSITYGAYGTVSGAAPMIRSVKIEAPQPWAWPFPGALNDSGYVTAEYMAVLSPDPAIAAPTIDIVSAGGPNPGGSFLAAAPRGQPENVISLVARVTPSSLAPNVEWEVVALDSSLVPTVPPDSVPRGASTSFVVSTRNISPNGIRWIPLSPTRSIIDRGRWPSDHPGALNRKALAYLITARVTANGQTVRSSSKIVQQDEKDVMREEYIDFGRRLDSIPPRDSLGTVGPSARNLTGDYHYWMTGSRLDSLMPAMQALSARRYAFQPRIESGYRNPVHHFVHARATSRNSQHLTGNATDWKILSAGDRPSGYTVDDWFTRLFYLTRNPTVDGCWEPAAEIKRTNPQGHTLDHAHSDWRVMTSCSDKWKTER